MKIALFLSILVYAQAGFTRVLPDIFYASQSEKADFCREDNHESEAYWRKLVDDQITGLIASGPEVIQNSYVTLSYFELFKTAPVGSSKFMSYVYANASHHLGRLVRFTKWPENHPLKKDDQKLVKGLALRLATVSVNQELSKRLMAHSLRLYKELAWSLAAGSLCGPKYVLQITTDPNLAEAYSALTTAEFLRPFITFEQTFLQNTMYSDFLIGNSAKAKMLDEMRFISFNGEEQVSFHSWCGENNCGTSSFDLINRIEFDVWSINSELEIGSGYEERIGNAGVEEVALSFLNSSR